MKRKNRDSPEKKIALTKEEQNLYNILVIDLEGVLGELQDAEQEMILSEQEVKLAEENLRKAIANWEEKKKVVRSTESAYEWFLQEYKECKGEDSGK